MILSKFMQRFRNDWLAKQEAKLKVEFAPKLAAIQESCQSAERSLLQQKNDLDRHKNDLDGRIQELERIKSQCDSQEIILKDRQVALEKANEELRTQLRLIEAKASPDSVWVEAFSLGYGKAWDTMADIWQSGLAKAVEDARTNAIDQTIRNINPVKPVHELLVKQREMELKRNQAKDDESRQKYDYYLKALGWALNGHSIHQD